MKRAAYCSYYSTSASSSSGGREQERFHSGPSSGMGAGSEIPLYRESLLVSSIYCSRRVVAIQYRTKVKQAQKGVSME